MEKSIDNWQFVLYVNDEGGKTMYKIDYDKRPELKTTKLPVTEKGLDFWLADKLSVIVDSDRIRRRRLHRGLRGLQAVATKTMTQKILEYVG